MREMEGTGGAGGSSGAIERERRLEGAEPQVNDEVACTFGRLMERLEEGSVFLICRRAS